ncbi:M48 family metallopeptidase [Pararobbsia silviterrae]|uniref:M48 family peptidase n=1 Tax=Pararobbsia silviterrae TaxID=1792498 RepID=A0A494YA57_9BURK|nr:M48 family metallopeptidase [Pararobbsia silviterrae]RKP59035.1 M48 family peptidase [Pararobbsia silviterrae]
MQHLKYLGAYPSNLLDQVRAMIRDDRLGVYLEKKYPQRHAVQTDKALYQYTNDLRLQFLRGAPMIDKVLYDAKLDVLHNALGHHRAISRVHGNKITARKEIRIASLFKDTPREFLEMIVVHELAHLKESEHNKAFYRLCEHMQPGYAQIEFDLRLYLTHRDMLREREKTHAPNVPDADSHATQST